LDALIISRRIQNIKDILVFCFTAGPFHEKINCMGIMNEKKFDDVNLFSRFAAVMHICYLKCMFISIFEI